MKLHIGFLLLILSACQATAPVIAPADHIVYQTVEKPVPVARTPPPDLLACFAGIPALTPAPNIIDMPDGLLLTPEQAKVLAPVAGGVLLPTAELQTLKHQPSGLLIPTAQIGVLKSRIASEANYHREVDRCAAAFIGWATAS